jgi:hypothetical protein
MRSSIGECEPCPPHMTAWYRMTGILNVSSQSLGLFQESCLFGHRESIAQYYFSKFVYAACRL